MYIFLKVLINKCLRRKNHKTKRTIFVIKILKFINTNILYYYKLSITIKFFKIINESLSMESNSNFYKFCEFQSNKNKQIKYNIYFLKFLKYSPRNLKDFFRRY